MQSAAIASEASTISAGCAAVKLLTAFRWFPHLSPPSEFCLLRIQLKELLSTLIDDHPAILPENRSHTLRRYVEINLQLLLAS